MGFTI